MTRDTRHILFAKINSMAAHEIYSLEDEWYTPKYIFDALGCVFDMDVAAAPEGYGCVPARLFCRDAFNSQWIGFVWCNPPFSGRNNKIKWVNEMSKHGNGILLTPDRSSAPWWQDAAKKSTSHLMVRCKIKFTPGPENKSNWKQPGCGTTLFAFGKVADIALVSGVRNGLGEAFKKI
jgi:hypothetical protein